MARTYVDLIDTLERIRFSWDALKLTCECGEGEGCDICEITYLLNEALGEREEEDANQ